MEKSLFKLYLLTIDSCIVKKGSEDLKITHVKIRNYRNLRDIDIGLAETVAIIGENNSGKSNFLKAITLPFLTDDNTYISIINIFEDESPIKQEDKIFVKSIDYIKGMEGEKCLFILTNDLATYLFNDNNTEANKTKNKLYVALTRSLNELSIYILKEVENKYTKKRIQDFFERYL